MTGNPTEAQASPPPEGEVQALVKAFVHDLADPMALEVVTQRLAHWNALRTALLRQTQPQDWRKFGDNYYLQESGTSELIIPGGVSLTGIRVEGPYLLEDDKGKFWFVRVIGLASAPFSPAQMEVTKALTSRDPFFGQEGDELKPYSEVRVENVEQKAQTQLRGKAVKVLFALNNLSEAELRAAGLDTSKIAGVSYKAGKKGGRAQVEAPSQAIMRLLDWLAGDNETLFKSLYRFLADAVEGQPAPKPPELATDVASLAANVLLEIQKEITAGKLAKDPALILERATALKATLKEG